MRKFSMSNESFSVLQKAKKFHDSTRNSFWWTPDSVASSRRSNERRWNELSVNAEIVVFEQFKHFEKAHSIYVKQNYSESCNHVYVVSEFYFDEKKTTITKINNILNNAFIVNVIED